MCYRERLREMKDISSHHYLKQCLIRECRATGQLLLLIKRMNGLEIAEAQMLQAIDVQHSESPALQEIAQFLLAPSASLPTSIQ